MTETATPDGVPPQVVEALKGMRKIDRGKLKLWELEELEEAIGGSVDLQLASDHPSIRFRRGLLWIWLRRDHPEFAFDDFREVDLDLLGEAFGGRDDEEEDEAENPTPAIPSGGATRSSSSASENSKPMPSSIATGG